MATIDELIQSVQSCDVDAVRSALDKHPELLTARNTQGVTPFLAALYSRKFEVRDFLLERGLKPDLYEASAAGELAAIEAHLEQFPGLLDAVSPDGWTALHLGAFFDHPEVVRMLLARGANVSAISGNALHNQPLHAAVAGRSLESAKLLLEHGADPNARQHGGYTALEAAAANGMMDAVQLLLQHGADPSLADDAGGTAASMAEAKGHREIAVRLAARQPQ